MWCGVCVKPMSAVLTCLFACCLCVSWRVYDYLLYVSSKFANRPERWQNSNPNMDMSIPRYQRSVDHLGWSSQMYFIVMVNVMGMLMIILGIETILHNAYNCLGDIFAPILIIVTLGVSWVTGKVWFEIGSILGIWALQSKRQRAVLQEYERTDQGLIPRWYVNTGGATCCSAHTLTCCMRVACMSDCFSVHVFICSCFRVCVSLCVCLCVCVCVCVCRNKSYRSLIERLRSEKYITTPRLIDDMFRHRFIKHNRTWIITQMEEIFSATNVKRAKRQFKSNYFIKRLGAMLKSGEERGGRERMGLHSWAHAA